MSNDEDGTENYHLELIQLIDENVKSVSNKEVRVILEGIKSSQANEKSLTKKEYESLRTQIGNILAINEVMDAGLKMKDEVIAKKDEVIAKKDAGLKMKDEVIAKKDAGLKMKDEVIAKQDAGLKMKDTELRKMQLVSVKDEFPVLSDTTISKPYFPKNHKHADVTLRDVNVDEINCIDEMFLGFWNAPFIQEARACDCEIEAQHLDVELIRSVLKGMKVDHLVEVVQNRTIAGAECDILLCYKPIRLPFAPVEIKKPGTCANERKIVFEGKKEEKTKNGKLVNRVAGEVFDQMKSVELFGYPTVAGMISTGNQRKLVGLIKSGNDEGHTPIGLKPALEKFQQFLNDQNSKLHTLPDSDANGDADVKYDSPEGKEVVLDANNSLEEVRRNIWGSDCIPSDNEKLGARDFEEVVKKSGEKIVAVLVLFIARSCSILHDYLLENPDIASGKVTVKQKMPCRVLGGKITGEANDKQEGVFNFGTTHLKKLDLDKFCLEEDVVMVIRHLGMGAYGNVCLGISCQGGRTCAVKFYHNKTKRKQFAEAEKTNWDAIYGDDQRIPKPFIREAAEGVCLIMPYLYAIKNKDRQKHLTDGSLVSALRSFAKSGFVHNDIKWRHIRCLSVKNKKGFLKRAPKAEDIILLVDLGDESLEKLSESNNEEYVEDWIKTSIATLRNRTHGDIPAHSTNEQTNKKHKSESI